MAISPKKPEFIVVGTSAHIFRSKDGGISWSQAYSVGARDGTIVGNGLENTCGLVVRFDPIDPKRCYFIYADVGLLKSENHGKSFEQIKISLTDIRITDIIVDPTDTKRIWICGKKHNGGFVYRSTDGGNTWNTKNHLFPGTIDNITLDHKSALYNRSIYVTSIEHGIYKSVDDGVSWLEANDGLPKSARKDVVSIQMHPDKTDTIRCLLGSSPIEGSGVYETKNGGQNWYRITENNAPFAMVRNLVIDPKNWDIMYVCQFNKWIGNKRFAGGLYKSLDSGKSWVHCYSGFKNAEILAISPIDSNILYLGTLEHPFYDDNVGPGLLKSLDGGMTWHNASIGLTNKNILTISVNPHDPELLIVGTNGNGFFVGQEYHSNATQ